MTTKERKNFVTFVKEVNDNPEIGGDLQKFIDDEPKPLDPKKVKEFFKSKGYLGVSLNDCKKLAAVRNTRAKINVGKSTQGY